MPDLTISEHIGYRVNAKSGRIQTDGLLTVYAERHNDSASLGEYGGDAYPIVEETVFNIGNKQYRAGIVLASDGVGQAAYVHPTLESKLKERLKKESLDSKDNVEALSVFLRTLYGPEIFKEANKSVYEYALRCFADVPPDGYFACNKANWERGQKVMPFYKRDSQSLGSRLTCVGLFLKFRKYVADNGIVEWDKDKADALRNAVESYIAGELETNVGKLFSHDDAPDATKRNVYFLANTVAVWFYVANDADGTVSAVALNCGDARCYLVDCKDGVRQISVDDAFDDGSMSAIVHFGATPRVDEQYHDRLFHARVVKAKYPCALLACSDGVYDTCPAFTKSEENFKYSLPYGDDQNANDFLFECNLLNALRRSYSYEDFSREIVFNFFAQSSAQKFAEHRQAGKYALVKRDDSGTLAGRFFGANNGLRLMEQLREEGTVTSLDKLREFVEASDRKPRIPYAHPHAQTDEEKNGEKIAEYAIGDFKSNCSEILRGAYSSAFDQMKADGETTLWNIENCENKQSAFSIIRLFLTNINLIKILRGTIDDWNSSEKQANGEPIIPSEWKQYAHVLAVSGMTERLTEIKFAQKLQELCGGASEDVSEDELKLKLYDWFEKCFFGSPLPDYKTVIGAEENCRPELDGMKAELDEIYASVNKADDAVKGKETKTENTVENNPNNAVEAEKADGENTAVKERNVDVAEEKDSADVAEVKDNADVAEEKGDTADEGNCGETNRTDDADNADGSGDEAK